MFLIILMGCAGTTTESSPPQKTPVEQNSFPEHSQTEDAPQRSPNEASLSEASEIAADPATNSEEVLWERLQQADTHYFVLMRHGLAPGTGDPSNFQLDDCSTQRNLSEEGRSQARRTGEAFKQRNIPVERVLSSQWCRCLETAKLMDIGTVEPFPPLNSFFQNRGKEPERTAGTREFMLTQSATPGVTVMVTHFVNIFALSDVGVSSGEMVVVQVNDQDELEVLGQLNPL